jgi:hypothetical protein
MLTPPRVVICLTFAALLAPALSSQRRGAFAKGLIDAGEEMTRTQEQRRLRRATLNREAAIYSDSRLVISCAVVDISASGARISLSMEAEIPNEFVLALERNGNVRRRCQLTWRSETAIGVRFVNEN